MPVRPCSSSHCSGADAEINIICKDLGWPVNHPVLTRDAAGPCVCSCSCLAFGTPIQISLTDFKAIEKIQVNDTILASGKNLKWENKQVIFSQGTTGLSRQKYTVLITYNDTALAVTSDHIFLLADNSLIAADRLTTDHKLVTPDGKEVVINSVHIGDYTAGFHHIATSKVLEDDNLTGHLLNTNGVVSGDYSLQLFYRDKSLEKSLINNHSDLPIVGSIQYVKRYGDACLNAPTTSTDFIRVSENNIHDISEDVFIPSSKTILEIPKDACGFISEEEAEIKSQEEMRAWNDPQSREWTEYLLNFHKTFYPDVIYHLDWADNTVNAYAWIEKGKRHIAIKGGLVRHWSLELEGIALVIAHELSHHYGGVPKFSQGLSCEGQSDYHAVRTIMRNVWFGEQYLTMTDKAIAQMANFFGVSNSPTAPSGSAGCNHPAGSCRIATYHAAVNLKPKPNCAI